MMSEYNRWRVDLREGSAVFTQKNVSWWAPVYFAGIRVVFVTATDELDAFKEALKAEENYRKEQEA
jgi:hypothetical protein